jgi:[citrate (pro-3S)-lyase] ligase
LNENNFSAASGMVPATTRVYLKNGMQHQTYLSERLPAEV